MNQKKIKVVLCAERILNHHLSKSKKRAQRLETYRMISNTIVYG